MRSVYLDLESLLHVEKTLHRFGRSKTSSTFVWQQAQDNPARICSTNDLLVNIQLEFIQYLFTQSVEHLGTRLIEQISRKCASGKKETC
jgi:hypothetical protein